LARPSDVQVTEIQAAVLRNKGGPLRIESLELEGPRDDEVLVGIVATGTCHTDIDFYDDWDAAAEPVVLGHEGAGVVERVGSGKIVIMQPQWKAAIIWHGAWFTSIPTWCVLVWSASIHVAFLRLQRDPGAPKEECADRLRESAKADWSRVL